MAESPPGSLATQGVLLPCPIVLYFAFVRACLMLRVIALTRRVLARRGRANNLVCGVEQARRACSTPHTKSGERRRRSQAIVMAIRHTLNKVMNDRVFKRA